MACGPYFGTRLPGSTTSNSGTTITLTNLANPDTFQILCPGMDGTYGAGNSYPTGVVQWP